MTGKIISIRDVRLQTVSVSLDTIKVGPKQVTLAIFRQLIEENLIAEDGTLNGLPWGHVNYFPDGHMRDHWHIVWQKGDQLRRAIVKKSVEFDAYYSNTTDAYMAARIRDIVLRRIAASLPTIKYYKEEYDCVRFERKGIKLNAYIPAGLLRWDLPRWDPEDPPDEKDLPEWFQREDRRILARRLDEEIATVIIERDRWRKTIQELATLPQLFIAV